MLVTGGAGFVGSTLVRLLAAETDHEVTVFDAFTYAGHEATGRELAALPGVRVVRGDVRDREAVRSALAGHPTVIHLAAASHVDRSLVEPDVFMTTNVGGTGIVCEEAGRAGVERLLHVSTDEVYGSIEIGAATEDAPLRPTSPYSATKAGADLLALAHHASHGLPVVVTRSTNLFGPYQHPEKLIPRSITQLLLGGTIDLYGDGGHRRDWLPVEDGCRALLLALELGQIGTVYNIAGLGPRPNLEVATALVEALDLDVDRIRFVEDRPGHDRRYAVDDARFAALGTWRTTSFDDALAATVRWYVDRRDWWAPLVADSHRPTRSGSRR